MEARTGSMPKELQGIADAIGGVFDSPLVQLGLRALAVYVVVFWLAAAYWAFRDLQLRTDNPVLPYLAAAFVIVFTPVFFLMAVVIYRIVRPHEKSDEVYERTLAEEAMLSEIETVKNCPTCRRRVDDEWIVCPTCRTRLNRVCPNCSKLVGLDWAICAWCGRDFERRDPVPAPASSPVPSSPPAPSMTPAPAAPTVAQALPARPSARSVAPRSTSRASSGRPAPGSLPER